jgi:hypothetical protein
MDTISTLIVFLAGVFIRLALPVAATLIAIYFLHRLDMRWQKEAESHSDIQVEKPECWEIKNCPPEQRLSCTANSSPQPCWQVRRLQNGYLREDCLTCKVFLGAPAPVHG